MRNLPPQAGRDFVPNSVNTDPIKRHKCWTCPERISSLPAATG
ncbi:hypothetical protein HMPREF9080_00359 [Cardiobacterium valvarum F0432]|uniref:Uncharacterized protein n=1 Tax=Cardiobacterium valvarum F0432 TaxID=797473 RepID=G9ZC77_9GAMM|nr:hypothetical protein HMPREF9080_00359 [Cardiobacterium valvarum F0432]